MLPKNKRFSREGFPKGKPERRFSFPWGDVSVYSGEPKVAVIAPKKAIKKAHDRNRARRRVYAAIDPQKLKKALIIRLKNGSLTTPQTEFSQAISG